MVLVPSRHVAAGTRVLLAALLVAAVAPAARADMPSASSHDLGALQVTARCSDAPGGTREFDVSVANRGDTGVGDLRLDAYFSNGTRLTFLPGFHDPRTGVPFHLAGRHAWSSVASLNPYTGFGIQVVVHAVRSTVPDRVGYSLSVQGVRHPFSALGCAAA